MREDSDTDYTEMTMGLGPSIQVLTVHVNPLSEFYASDSTTSGMFLISHVTVVQIRGDFISRSRSRTAKAARCVVEGSFFN